MSEEKKERFQRLRCDKHVVDAIFDTHEISMICGVEITLRCLNKLNAELDELRAKVTKHEEKVEKVRELREHYIADGRRSSNPRRDTLVRDQAFLRILEILDAE